MRLLLILLPLVLLGCDPYAATKQSLETTAAAINEEFVKVRHGQEMLVGHVRDLYARLDALDLSTKGMDAEDGGNYATFPDHKYYYKKEPQGSALYASFGRPADEAIRRQVKFLEYVDPFLQEAGRASDVQNIAFYGMSEPVTLALISPWIDVVSRLPPGLRVEMFEWYMRGLKSAGPPLWSTQPFTDLSWGWVMDVSVPVLVDGQVKGVGVSSMALKRLAAKYLNENPAALVLMGADTTVVGISPSAQQVLHVKALEDFDFVKQMTENTFAPARFRLNDPSQPQDLQVLGRGVQEAEEVSFTLNGVTYQAFRRQLPENTMLVVGLVRR